MYLKRQYERDNDGVLALGENGRVKAPIGVQLLSYGNSTSQHFSPRTIAAGIQQGWVKMDGQKGTITLNAVNATMVYNVVRMPGHYCCHCGEKLDSADRGRMAQIHVAEKHAGVESPNTANPAGYEVINYFDCVEANPREALK